MIATKRRHKRYAEHTDTHTHIRHHILYAIVWHNQYHRTPPPPPTKAAIAAAAIHDLSKAILDRLARQRHKNHDGEWQENLWNCRRKRWAEKKKKREARRIHQINWLFVVIVRPGLWHISYASMPRVYTHTHMRAIFGRVKLSSSTAGTVSECRRQTREMRRKKSVAERKRENYSRINTTVRIRHASLATHELVSKTNAKVTAAAHAE